jgi:hypothetical protein
MLSLRGKCSLLNFNEMESMLCHNCDLAMAKVSGHRGIEKKELSHLQGSE